MIDPVEGAVSVRKFAIEESLSMKFQQQ